MIANPVVYGDGGSIKFGTFRLEANGSPLSLYFGQAFNKYDIPFVIGMTWRDYVEQINVAGVLHIYGNIFYYEEEGMPFYAYPDGFGVDDVIIDGRAYNFNGS